MPENHLVIGLGGTGGSVIRSLRKRIYQNHRQEDAPGVNLRYLYADTSDDMMSPNDPSWKILGRSVQLQKSSQLLMKALNFGAVLSNVSEYPGISPWLGSPDAFRAILNAGDAAKIYGGQRRRLGRFLFAANVRDYCAQVGTLVREMQTNGTTETVFHVCCGLAGGTGAGSVVDAVAQIRRLFPDTRYRILIYALLPEKDPKPVKDQGNYHANGYAALLTLNALAAGVYEPHDVSAKEPTRLRLSDPFNACYLISDENEAGHRIDLEHGVPDLISAFLYQKIVAARDFVWDSLRRQESYENMDRSPEMSPSGARAERARMFFTMGIKQVSYPEEEILEYLTYSFARQAALQLRFNNWSDSLGYLNEPVNASVAEFVTRADTRQKWRLTDDHLTLSCGILPDEIANRRWKTISGYWGVYVASTKTQIRQDYADRRKQWLDRLTEQCDKAFNENYREFGVAKFYQLKEANRREHVLEIRRLIERDLFEDWRNGARSLHDIDRLLDALSQDLSERAKTVDDKIARLHQQIADTEAKQAEHRREWAKLSLLTEWMGKHEKLFDAYAEGASSLAIQRTRAAGLAWAKRLLEALYAEIQNLSSEAGRAATLVDELARDFKRATDERCADKGKTDLTGQVVRFYEPEMVRSFDRRLTIDRQEQQRQASAVRTEIANRLGDNQRFSDFTEKLGRETLLDAMSETCQRSTIDAHNRLLAQESGLSRVLGVNVLERLSREYSGNPEALRLYVNDVVKNARSYLRFNEEEAGRRDSARRQESFTVIMPDTADLKPFRTQLASEFANARHGETAIVTHPGRANEITLVTIASLFPVRYAQDAAFLRQRYEQRMKEDGAPLQLHGEGDGSQFPPLYQRTVTGHDLMPLLLLGKAMGVVTRVEDPQTGLDSTYLVTRDESGFDNAPVRLGETLDDVLRNANGAVYDQLETAVGQLLASEYLHKAKRDEVKDLLLGEVRECKQKAGNNPLDKSYLAMVDAAKKADQLLAARR